MLTITRKVLNWSFEENFLTGENQLLTKKYKPTWLRNFFRTRKFFFFVRGTCLFHRDFQTIAQINYGFRSDGYKLNFLVLLPL